MEKGMETHSSKESYGQRSLTGFSPWGCKELDTTEGLIFSPFTHYNRIKSVLAEKNKTGTWLSEQMGRNLGTVSRWMTNKVQPSVEQLYDIANHLEVDVKDLLVSSKEYNNRVSKQ